MDATLASLLSFYLFSTGRRLFAMQEVSALATAQSLGPLGVHCDLVIAHDTGTRALEATWSSDKDAAQYAPEAKQADILVDVALSALRDAINVEARDSAPGDPLGDAAVKLEKEAFPQGVAHIIKMTFVDELAELQRIIALLQSAEWSSVVPKLGLDRRLARLTELEKTYRTAIALSPKTVSFAQVKDARAKGQSLMLESVAMILGLYPSDGAADLAARGALLAPILRQNEAIREYLKTRRAIEDVDPSTGKVETPPAAGGGAAAPVTPAGGSGTAGGGPSP